MAEGKKSFILYADLIHTVRKMPEDKAGKLLLTILQYVNDEDPLVEDMMVDLVFEPIKRQMKRDLEKYEGTKDKFSKAGNASGLARRLNKRQLYILKMYSEDTGEEFLKIGITDDTVGRRYSSSGEGSNKLPYKFEIVHQCFPVEGSYSPADIEGLIQVKFKNSLFSPAIKFGGHTECYKSTVENDIIKYLTSLNIVEHRSTTLNNVEHRSTTLNNVEHRSTTLNNVEHNTNDVSIRSSNRTVTVNVNDNVNVNDTVTDNVNKKIDREEKASIQERKLSFSKSLISFEKEFGAETVREFFDYWSEANENGKKMRFEMEDVFDKRRRLDTWKKNEKKFNKAPPQNNQSKIENIANVVVSATEKVKQRFSNE